MSDAKPACLVAVRTGTRPYVRAGRHAVPPDGKPIYVITDNLSANQSTGIARAENSMKGDQMPEPLNSPIPKSVDTRYEVAFEALGSLIGIAGSDAGAAGIRTAMGLPATAPLDAIVRDRQTRRRELHPDDSGGIDEVFTADTPILRAMIDARVK